MNQPTPPQHSASEPIDARLQRHLDDQATVVQLGATPLDVVVRRAQQRRQRRTTGLAVLATFAIVGTCITSIELLSREPHRRLVHGNGPAADDAETDLEQLEQMQQPTDLRGTITPVESNLAWSVVTPDEATALAYAYSPWSSTGGGPIFAYATQPGPATDPAAPVLYRSDDGVNWRPVSKEAPYVDVRTIVGDANTLYAIGTAAATAASPESAVDLVLRVSRDGGTSWSDSVLSRDLRTLASLRGVGSVTTGDAQIAAGLHGVLVSATTNVQFDIAEKLASDHELRFTPDGVTATPYACNDGWATADTSAPMPSLATVAPVDLATGATAPAADEPVPAEPVADAVPMTTIAMTSGSGTVPNGAACATSGEAPSTYTWDELGVDAQAVAAYFAPPRLYTSSDGASFTEVPYPGDVDRGARVTQIQLFALPDGFAMLSTVVDHDLTGSTLRLHLSPDGVTWRETSLPDLGPYAFVSGVGRTDDGTLTLLGNVGFDLGQRVVAATSADDGATWTTTALDGLITDGDGSTATLQWGAGSVGPTGITVAAMINIDPFVDVGPASITVDGVIVTQTDQDGTMVFTDAVTGAELGRVGSNMYRDDGTFDTTNDVNASRDPTTGDIAVQTADGSSVRITAGDLSSMYETAYRDANRLVILHSDDGITWSRDDAADIAPFSPAWVTGFVATPTQVLVTVTDPQQRNGMDRPTTYVLVGTPIA